MESQNKVITLTCPHCGSTIKMYFPANPGFYKVKCANKACGKETQFNFKPAQTPPSPPKTEDVSQKENVNTETLFNPVYDAVKGQSGKLMYKCFGGLKKVEYILKPGDNIVGRADKSVRSDFEISGDNTISRRSVNINYSSDGKFRLEVVKATNPISLNGKELAMTDKIYLKDGDIITMGKTNIYFSQLKKK